MQLNLIRFIFKRLYLICLWHLAIALNTVASSTCLALPSADELRYLLAPDSSWEDRDRAISGLEQFKETRSLPNKHYLILAGALQWLEPPRDFEGEVDKQSFFLRAMNILLNNAAFKSIIDSDIVSDADLIAIVNLIALEVLLPNDPNQENHQWSYLKSHASKARTYLTRIVANLLSRDPKFLPLVASIIRGNNPIWTKHSLYLHQAQESSELIFSQGPYVEAYDWGFENYEYVSYAWVGIKGELAREAVAAATGESAKNNESYIDTLREIVLDVNVDDIGRIAALKGLARALPQRKFSRDYTSVKFNGDLESNQVYLFICDLAVRPDFLYRHEAMTILLDLTSWTYFNRESNTLNEPILQRRWALPRARKVLEVAEKDANPLVRDVGEKYRNVLVRLGLENKLSIIARCFLIFTP